MGHGPICIAVFSRSFPDAGIEQDSVPFGYLETEVNATGDFSVFSYLSQMYT